MRLMMHPAVCKKQISFGSKKWHTQHLQDQNALTRRHYPVMSNADKDRKLRV